MHAAMFTSLGLDLNLYLDAWYGQKNARFMIMCMLALNPKLQHVILISVQMFLHYLTLFV